MCAKYTHYNTQAYSEHRASVCVVGESSEGRSQHCLRQPIQWYNGEWQNSH